MFKKLKDKIKKIIYVIYNLMKNYKLLIKT
jgi:hypothetical protein